MADQILTESEIKELEKLLKEATAEEGVENIQINWKQLQQQARKFISGYEKLEKAQQAQQLKNIKMLINNPESPNSIKNLRGGDQAFYTKARYLLAFQFDKAVNNFLEGLPKEAIYVYEDKKTGKVSTYKMNMAELAKYANKDGRLFISLSKLQTEERGAIEMDSQSGISQEHIATAQAAYTGVSNRLARYFQRKAEGTLSTEAKQMQAQGGVLMWKLGKDWTLARVLNKGDLKEAYAAFLLSQHKTSEDKLYGVGIGAPDYYSHELISTFYHFYIHGVTNQAAITGEDIVGPNSQYGVKSIGANLPSINQYLTTAKWILSQKNIFTKDELKAFIEKAFPKGAHRNIVLGTTSNLTEETLNELLKNNEKFAVKQTIKMNF